MDGLPEDIRPVIAGLTPGQISRPIELESAIGIFLLRELEQVAAGAPDALSVEYALFITGGGQEAARAVAQDIDVCDDLYGVARGLPEERLIREVQPVGALPADVRSEIEKLDLNEVSTAITRGGLATVLMLCDRQAGLESTVDLEIVGTRLLNTRLGTMAADHLSDLRANTVIRDIVN